MLPPVTLPILHIRLCLLNNYHYFNYGTENDLSYISPADVIKDLTVCKKCGSNFLLNVGPLPNGYLRTIDSAILEIVGKWVSINREIMDAVPCDIKIENKDDDFILQTDEAYYILCNNLPMVADPNVALANGIGNYELRFKTDKRIKSIHWLDNGEELKFTQDGSDTLVYTTPFSYGNHLVVRAAKAIFE